MVFLSLAGNIESPCLLIHPLILTSHLWLCPCHFPFLHISLQVIYKKFQIPCPFEEFSANSTAAHLSLNVSSHGHEYNNGVVHEDEDAHCITRMFTINSQVGSSGQNRVYMSGLRPQMLNSAGVLACLSSHTYFGRLIQESHVFVCSSQTAYTIPILAFAFVCHPEVLPIYTELRKWVTCPLPAIFDNTSVQNVAFTQLSTIWF